MFGIIEAFVFCPNNINIQLLPYKDERNELLSFPRGRFIGVYFTEELIKARSVGYMVYPIRGYLYEKGERTKASVVHCLWSMGSVIQMHFSTQCSFPLASLFQ